MATLATGFALLRRSDFSTPSALFSAIFALDFIESVLQEIKPVLAILRRRRGHGSRNLPVGAGDVYQALACRVWIQGKGSVAGKTTKEGMRNALNHLSERSSEKLNGLRKTYHIHRTFCFSGAGAFEKQLCSNFQSLFCHLERSGDVSHGKAGSFERCLTSLPVGIWHYQATVMLSNGEPFLVHARVHGTASNMERARRPQVLT